jgi:protein gp37
MADNSTIEWTETTWNPTTGCDKVSPGCDNCYACALSRRLKSMGSAKYQNDGDPRTSGPGFGLTVHPDTLTAPLHWRTRAVLIPDPSRPTGFANCGTHRSRREPGSFSSNGVDAHQRLAARELDGVVWDEYPEVVAP